MSQVGQKRTRLIPCVTTAIWAIPSRNWYFYTLQVAVFELEGPQGNNLVVTLQEPRHPQQNPTDNALVLSSSIGGQAGN